MRSKNFFFFKYVGVNDENMKYDRAIISQTTFSPLYFNGLGTQVKGPHSYIKCILQFLITLLFPCSSPTPLSILRCNVLFVLLK